MNEPSNPMIDMDQIQWPCLQYGQIPQFMNGAYVCCKSHKELNKRTLDFMSFVNKNWGNPLRHSDGHGGFVTDPSTPMELQGLGWSDMPYLCHMVTHTNFDKGTGNTIKFAHVD
ncbi:hypothetical protein BGX20_006607, partial [Mortierella sp. AD010]